MRWHKSGPVRRPSGFVEPCLPTNGHAVPTGSQWVYEIKHDGFRFICRRDGERVRVFSRRGNDWTDRVPLIAEAVAALRVRSVTIDGEGVVCRPDGISDFDRLRAAVGRLGSRNAFLYAFDLLEINGTDLRRDPWQERRTVLVRLLRTTNAKGIRLSDHLDSNGAVAFRHACRMGLEGIVAKRRDRAVSIGTMRRLDQGQEPGGAGCNADHGMVKQRQEAGPPTDLEREYRQPIEDIGRAFKRMKTRDDFALVGRFLMLYYASEKLALGIEGINQNLPADCVFRVGSQPGLTKAEIGCEGIMPANL